MGASELQNAVELESVAGRAHLQEEERPGSSQELERGQEMTQLHASSKEQKGSRSWRSSRAPGVTVEVWNVCPFVPEGKKKEAAPKRNLVKSR